MYFQFLIEDKSGEILVDLVMKKLQCLNSNIQYNCKPFHGIGGFTPKNTVKEKKNGKLLDGLATYLSGFNRSLGSMGKDAAVFIVVDNDERDTDAFRNELEAVAQSKNIAIDHVFCIAVEEMEAWLLGDEQAVLEAYPQAKTGVIRKYEQDSICGTWEILAEAIYPGGLKKLTADKKAHMNIGEVKCTWAENIGKCLNIHNNRSPSFNYFLDEIEKRI